MNPIVTIQIALTPDGAAVSNGAVLRTLNGTANPVAPVALDAPGPLDDAFNPLLEMTGDVDAPGPLAEDEAMLAIDADSDDLGPMPLGDLALLDTTHQDESLAPLSLDALDQLTHNGTGKVQP